MGNPTDPGLQTTRAGPAWHEARFRIGEKLKEVGEPGVRVGNSLPKPNFLNELQAAIKEFVKWKGRMVDT